MNMPTEPYIDPGFVSLSPHFEYEVGPGLPRLSFDWDAAAIGPAAELLIVEKELTRPVALHIQGHVSRATFMVARGEKIRKVVWVVREEDFQDLWRIVEGWRAALAQDIGAQPPTCEYWTLEGVCLAISPKFRTPGSPGIATGGSNVSADGAGAEK